jgi:hypothetical protein
MMKQFTTSAPKAKDWRLLTSVSTASPTLRSHCAAPLPAKVPG